MFDLYIHRKAEYKHLHHIIIHRIYIFEIAKFKAIIFKTFNNKNKNINIKYKINLKYNYDIYNNAFKNCPKKKIKSTF